MEEEYWERFLETVKVTDYLCYKGMQICKQIIKDHEGGINGESDYSDRLGPAGDSCRRI